MDGRGSFFVLSGLLITQILLNTKQDARYFKNFFVRRALRICPLYYCLLIFMFLVVPFVSPAHRSVILARSSPWWAYPLLLQNFLVHASSGAAGALGVTWSVAIEAEFYVVWAILVRRCSCVQLWWIAASVICLSPALRLAFAVHQIDVYSNPFCRFDGLMMGAMLVLAVRSPSFVPSRFLRWAWLCLFAAGPLAIASGMLHAMWLTFSMSAAASAGFVYIALFAKQKWLVAILTNTGLVYVGTISYGLYLLHKIPFDAIQLLHLDRYPALGFLCGLAASFLAAALSWRFLEKPFLNLKRFFI
jgi:peptidoglycan/LPS O-acetylase OafA/YrhL